MISQVAATPATARMELRAIVVAPYVMSKGTRDTGEYLADQPTTKRNGSADVLDRTHMFTDPTTSMRPVHDLPK